MCSRIITTTLFSTPGRVLVDPRIQDFVRKAAISSGSQKKKDSILN